jgi:sulfatase maturation enzyme AslB (radical SAM superfamily)
MNLSFQRVDGLELPIFIHPELDWTLYFTPGWMVKVDRDHSALFEAHLKTNPAHAPPEARRLVQAACEAEAGWASRFLQPFEPVCLTLYPNLGCNLSCIYCFAGAPVGDRLGITMGAALSALELVARNCARKDKPLSVVFHGGGEPVLSWRFIDELGAAICEVSQRFGLPVIRYIATNGVMSESRARWLARSFDLIGLSCDGPPEIQDAQRPARARAVSSSTVLERTARILREAGTPFTVRVTVTPWTAVLQPEICSYICEWLKPAAIHAEPVYLGGRTAEADLGRDLDGFTDAFLMARRLAKTYGISWESSASRFGERHGAHCNVLKQVLHLVPGDVATACFKTVDARQAAAKGMIVGRYEPPTQEFRLDLPRVGELRAQYSPSPACRDCWLQFQCAHGCPNSCELDGHPGQENPRCEWVRSVAALRLLEHAASLGDSAVIVEAPLTVLV